MINLPRCKYPSFIDTSNHGIQPLPERLPLQNLLCIQKYRSANYTPVGIKSFDSQQILELSRIIAKSFVEKEPMNRHLHPPKEYNHAIHNFTHIDPYGIHPFGEWTKENIFYWFIRLMVLTNPSSSIEDIQINEDLLNLSLAILNEDGQLIGGAYNITLDYAVDELKQRSNDPFLEVIQPFIEPPLSLIIEQEHTAIKALHNKYPSFKKAHTERKIGCHFLVARTNLLPVTDTFELVAASVEQFLKMNYKYLMITATNEWTGAACEVLGGVKVHYAPYRAEKRVPESSNARADQVHSKDGFLSDKDSGSMFYLIKLQ
jgi:hypothetical protein